MSADPVDDPLAVRLLYTPHDPTPRQHVFHLLDRLEVLEAMYGGATGGGKSDALLASALRYVDVPGYSALLLRRTYPELAMPEGIMTRSHEWLANTDARWSAVDFRWHFPSGATLTFGHLSTELARFRYQGAAFQFIGFDELTTFRLVDYLYLFSRLRRPEITPDLPKPVRRQREQLAAVPLRMRSATNPGGRGHTWVKRRFITRTPDPDDPDDSQEKCDRRVFVPALLRDNPHVDPESYEQALAQLDPVTRARYMAGDWDVEEGDKVYSSGQVGAAKYLGDVLDAMLAAGTMPPPARGLAIGIDWGEHSHALIGWPLPGGGMYVVAECVGESAEPTAFTRLIVDTLDTVVQLGRRPRPHGWRPDLDPITLGRRVALEPPALPLAGHPLTLVEDHRYDAAGVQSMKTYIGWVRTHGHPLARTDSVPFGAPAAVSGKVGSGRAFKAEIIGHVRRLLLRSAYGERVAVMTTEDLLKPPPLPHPMNREWAGALALGARCRVLREQLPQLEWDDKEAGKIVKENDHGPDALLALLGKPAKEARRKRPR